MRANKFLLPIKTPCSPPRAGATLTYKGEPYGHVLRVEENLCWFELPDGETSLFIWRFKDGFNGLFDWPNKLHSPSLASTSN